MTEQSTPSHLEDQVTFPQVLLNGVWHDARAEYSHVGGRGYSTLWTVLDEHGRMPTWDSRPSDGPLSTHDVGFSDHAFRRMLEEGRARFQSPEDRDAWADEESARRIVRDLSDRERAAGDGLASDRPPVLRRVPEAGTTREALRRLLHVRGTQWEQHTGEAWGGNGEAWGGNGEPGKRRDLIRELYQLGPGATVPSSSKLGLDELSILVDWLTTELEEAGFDLKRADAEYAARCAERERTFGGAT